MMILRWFLSKTVREAVALRGQVRRLLNHQRDILPAEASGAITTAVQDFGVALSKTTDAKGLQEEMDKLEKVANKWFRAYPHASWRENFEMLLVALAVAMGIRTFLLQPFKIPTGSMQPTLFGVTSTPDFTKPLWLGGSTNTNFTIPGRWQRFKEKFAGVSYVHLRAKHSGTYEGATKPFRLLIFNIKQTIFISGHPHTLWFPPDGGAVQLPDRAGLKRGMHFEKGDEIMKLKVVTGDHLFVDRLTFNFRKPDRGEIIVFETRGIHGLRQDQFYIKRLVGLSGETVQLGDDRHVIIDGERLTAATPHFENVYTFDPDVEAADSTYSGHVNDPRHAPWFARHPGGYTIPEGHLMVMGDNTINSLDSRAWGSFPATNVIGKAWFIYWPITDRFGWGYR